MCGRYGTRAQKQEIAARVHAKRVFDEPWLPSFNIAPSTFQPLVRLDRDGDVELALARWGLVPFFTKSLAAFKSFSTINARAEGIATAPTWREPFRKRRGLIEAGFFYEWKNVNLVASESVAVASAVLDREASANTVGHPIPRADVAVGHDNGSPQGTPTPPDPVGTLNPNGLNGNLEAKLFSQHLSKPQRRGSATSSRSPAKAPTLKQPYAISLTTADPMYFACLWDAWKNPDTGDWLQSYSIITTDANELMSAIHPRMPVILPRRHHAQWLDRDFGTGPGEAEQLLALLRPFDSALMQMAPCNPGIGRTTGPNVITGPEALVCPTPIPGLPLNSA